MFKIIAKFLVPIKTLSSDVGLAACNGTKDYHIILLHEDLELTQHSGGKLFGLILLLFFLVLILFNFTNSNESKLRIYENNYKITTKISVIFIISWTSSNI
jgi:hypothetical protein